MTRLEELPSRMDRLESQFVQLRTEIHDEFSAVREEMRSVQTGLGAEIRSGDAGLRQEMRSVETGLREAIAESRVHTRVLFEEYVGRLAVVDEGKNAKARKRGPKKTL
ncbi:MAG: hypothetical protein H0W08_18890 [Acidobacteria bacterium]|nr:hypothetical protein [Acidobacteriota bacterium]